MKSRKWLGPLLMSAFAAALAMGGLIMEGKQQLTKTAPSLPSGDTFRYTGAETYPENMARQQLLELLVNCRMYWNNNGGQACAVDAVQEKPYHFTLHPKDWTDEVGEVRVKILDGTSEDFSAISNRVGSPITWRIDLETRIWCHEVKTGACAAYGETSYQQALDEARRWWGPVPDGTRALKVK